MKISVYLSNLAAAWPVERQRELLAAHVPGWPKVPTYSDLLSPVQRKAHSLASLTGRRDMLRRAANEIVVAALPCLGWDQVEDFLQCLAAIQARGATLVALDTGRRTAPDASPDEIAEAAREFVKGRRASRGGPAGSQVSAERREAEANDAAMRIKDRWRLPTKDYPTDELLAEAKICRNTANKYLRPRPEAQRLYRESLAERDRGRRNPVEVQEQMA